MPSISLKQPSEPIALRGTMMHSQHEVAVLWLTSAERDGYDEKTEAT